jgi:hypothetical protein
MELIHPHYKVFAMPDFKKALFGMAAVLCLSAITGFLFQLAVNQICTTHLALTLVSGILFWCIAGPYVFHTATRLSESRIVKWQKVSALGIGLVVLNQVFVFACIEFLMTALYGCKDLLNTWLFNGITNNVLINSLCFVGFVLAGKHYSKKTQEANLTATESSDSKEKTLQHISVKYGSTVSIVPVQNIVHIEAEHNCITLFCETGKHVLYQSLKSIEKNLPDNFVRVHRSHIVNRDCVAKIENIPTGDALLTLRNQTTVRMSRTYKKNLSSIKSAC